MNNSITEITSNVYTTTDTLASASESSAAANSENNVESEDIIIDLKNETVTETVVIEESNITTMPPVTDDVTEEITNTIKTEEVSVVTTVLEETENTEITSEILSEIDVIPLERASFMERYGFLLLFLLFAVIGYLYYSLKKEKKRKIFEAEKSARKRDLERINAEKDKSGKNKSKKGNIKKIKVSANSVIDTIPYKKLYPNGIALLSDNLYSKVYTFNDENYNMSDDYHKEEILTNYTSYINSLDDSVDCQIIAYNTRINIEDFKNSTFIPHNEDEYNYLRDEYNEKILNVNLLKGENSIVKRLYLTLTIKTADEETAKRKFNLYDLELKNSFSRIGNTELRPLTAQERVELLKDIFIGVDEKIQKLKKKDFASGIEKLYCCPDYFEFKPDYFMFDDFFARTIYIEKYASDVYDDVITNLMKINLEIIVTTNIIAYNQEKAKKLIQHKITSIDTNMMQRESKAAARNNFSNTTPIKTQHLKEGYQDLYERIASDQKLFFANTIILVKANSFEELNHNTDIIIQTLKQNNFEYGRMRFQQEKGMTDCLPIGYQRKFENYRSLPTDCVAIFQPFNAKEMRQPYGIYYGINKLSDNIITFDRIKSLINPSGFILGCPGSGKSFFAKRQIAEVYLRYKNTDIMIIDPENEYGGVINKFKGAEIKISLGSKNYINPFEVSESLFKAEKLDTEIDILGEKSVLITSFLSCMDAENPINSQEKSFIDRCVKKTYEKTNYLNTHDKKDVPTLGTFYEVISKETEKVDDDMKNKLLLMLEYYVTGAAKYYNNKTNVDVDNRLISFNINDLPNTLKTQSMLLILDYIWNRLSTNRKKGISTWVFIDEIYLLFGDKYALDFLKQLYKRARKYGGVVTGITQNVEDLLRDDDTRTMLSNSEFLVLMKQAPADINKLKDTLHFNDGELRFLKNIKSGEGILMFGSSSKDIIPFYDDFPQDTELYKIFSTKWSEKALT